VSAAQMVKDWAFRFAHLPLPDDVPDYASELFPLMPFGPVIDGDSKGLPDVPKALFDKGEFNKVPLMIGSNRDGGGYFGPMLPLLWGAFPLTGFNFDKLLDWFFPDASDRAAGRALYGGEDFPTNHKRFERFIRDSMFPCTNRDMSTSWSRAGVPAHTYMFSMDLHEWAPPIDAIGTAHGFELIFTFRNWYKFYSTLALRRKSFKHMADIMSCTWASFVKCHAPKCAEPPPNCAALDKVPAWPVFNHSAPQRQYMSLKEQPTVEHIKQSTKFGEDEFPGDDRCDFWAEVNLDWQNIREKVTREILESKVMGNGSFVV